MKTHVITIIAILGAHLCPVNAQQPAATTPAPRALFFGVPIENGAQPPIATPPPAFTPAATLTARSSPPAATGAPVTENRPPADATLFNSKWYRLYLEKTTWKHAQAKCRSLGGQLVCIPDAPTQAFLADFGKGLQLWIGATDEKVEGRWVWVDGTEMKFKAWVPGEPQGKRAENFLILGKRPGAPWFDGPENLDCAGFICEWPASALVGTVPVAAATQATPQATGFFGPGEDRSKERPPQTTPQLAGFLRDQSKIFPFVAELGNMKLDPLDKSIPDELEVTFSGDTLKISGTKKGNTKVVMGRKSGNHGKLVLISRPIPQSGTVVAGIASGKDANSYGLILEMTSGAIRPQIVNLFLNQTYHWSISTDGGNLLFQVTKDGVLIDSTRALANEVKAFGFYSAVRYPGNRADLTVNVARHSK